VRQIGTQDFAPGKITQTLVDDYSALVMMQPDEVARRAA
jgi:hypothetical protein